MRVVSGRLGGRNFKAPSYNQRTHPMGEKVCGALFNILGDITGLTVLDAFAGSGALSIEAISRGARKAYAVEVDRTAQQTIKSNATLLGVESEIKLICSSISSWMRTNPEILFDIVLCDPPHDNLQEPILQELAYHVKSGCVMVLSWPGRLKGIPLFENLKELDCRMYGDVKLIFYRRD